MNIARLPADEAAVRRYIEDLWIPYHREREAVVEDFALADDVDLVAEELTHRLERHRVEGHRAWIAVDGPCDADEFVSIDGELVGFVTTDIDESPSVFDRPTRLIIGDIYVRDSHRGTGVARKSVARARTRARECGCPEIRLDVDVANDRALAFYEKLDFEPVRYTMRVSVEQ